MTDPTRYGGGALKELQAIANEAPQKETPMRESLSKEREAEIRVSAMNAASEILKVVLERFSQSDGGIAADELIPFIETAIREQLDRLREEKAQPAGRELSEVEILSLAFEINKIREQHDGPPFSTNLARELAPHISRLLAVREPMAVAGAYLDAKKVAADCWHEGRSLGEETPDIFGEALDRIGKRIPTDAQAAIAAHLARETEKLREALPDSSTGDHNVPFNSLADTKDAQKGESK